MTLPTPNAPESLRQEILEQARRQKEEILGRARREAEAIVAKADTEAQRFRKERLEAAKAEAKRRVGAILATVPVEAGRLRSARIEELLEAIHDSAREHLQTRAGPDYRETVARLCVEALRQMSGDTFRLRLSAAHDGALGLGLPETVQSRSGRSRLTVQLVVDANLKDGDVLIEDEGGRQVWNLSLDTRLERCWPELRRQIAAQAGFMQQGTA